MTEIAYDGIALRSGSMDVRELGPALLSAGDLFQRANRVLNGDRAVVAVKVQAGFQRGSFGIDLQVVQNLLEQTKGMLLGGNVTAADNLLGLLGLGGSQIGLIGLIKWIGKRKMPTAVPAGRGIIKLSLDGNTLEIPADVLPLFNDRDTREALRGVLRPLTHEGIEVFQVRRNRRVVQSVSKEETALFEDVTLDEHVIYEGERTAPFEVVVASFEERYKWRFSDGDSTFTADIEDEDFFRKVQHREVFFGKGDALEVRLHTRSYQTPTGLRTEHRVLAVLRIIPATRQQIPLLPPEPRRRR